MRQQLSLGEHFWRGNAPATIIVVAHRGRVVRRIFASYREFGWCRRVKEETDRLGLRTKHRTTKNGAERGGKPFSVGHLYRLLANPIYTGQIGLVV